MKVKLAKRAFFSLITVALSSLALWGLADQKPESTTVMLAVIGIIITTCIWFSLAWQFYDAKPKEALPALAICLMPYLMTAGLDLYMAPYYYNGGGNLWASFLDFYGNILFNTNYLLLAGWPGSPMLSASIAILLLQILLPFAFAYILKLITLKSKSTRLD